MKLKSFFIKHISIITIIFPLLIIPILGVFSTNNSLKNINLRGRLWKRFRRALSPGYGRKGNLGRKETFRGRFPFKGRKGFKYY